MRKDFLPYDIVRNNSLKLAHKIHEEGFIPDVIYASLRGVRISET
jgi:hypoxanthine phosphoribosyltransferase